MMVSAVVKGTESTPPASKLQKAVVRKCINVCVCACIGVGVGSGNCIQMVIEYKHLLSLCCHKVTHLVALTPHGLQNYQMKTFHAHCVFHYFHPKH